MPVITSTLATVAAYGAALSSFVVGNAGGYFIGKAMFFALKAGALIGLNLLLTKRDDPLGAPDASRSQVFTSGPARWVVGRRKVGGVVMYFGEDYDVSGTEGGGGPGADDIHLIMAISEGSCSAIEAIWIAGERLDIKFEDDAKTVYSRRGALPDDTAAAKALLPLDLDPGAPTWWDPRLERYRETPETGRLLDPDDEDDAELIRRAELSGSVNIYPNLDTAATGRWATVRTYTDRADTAVLNRPTPFTDWTTEHRLDGIAGLHIRLRQWTKHEFDDRVFTGGVPNLQFLIRGIEITHPDPDKSTGTVTQWTNNAAAVRYWWHTERRGIPPESIDRDAFVAAYKVCETKITPSLPESWPDDREPDWAKDDAVLSFRKYSIDGVITSGEDPSRIERAFDDAWQGFVVEEGGALHYWPGSDRIVQPVEIAGADILDHPAWQPAPALAERTNAVTLAIEQSSFHDWNSHALSEIVDTEKREKVDGDLHLPQDIGTFRYTVNPAQAYSLGVITLRRARNSGTLSLSLPPGNADDPICYLAMTPGLVYTVDIPEEGIDARRMLLVDKRMDETMRVDVTLVDAPIGMYSSDYKLPEIPAPPEHVPTPIGARPPKPTGLTVTHQARVSNDGTVHFVIKATVDATALRTVFRLVVGDDEWEAETTSNSYTFSVNVPRRSMEITARHIDKNGIRSLPVRANFTPDYSAVALPRPIWEDVVVYGGTLRLVFERVYWGAPIAGVEVRYTRLDLGSTTTLPTLTEAGWNSAPVLRTEAVQIVRNLDINLNAIAERSGRYGLFARYVATVSGVEPVRGPISYLREVEIEVPERTIATREESPLFSGASNNLEKWIGRAGDAAGQSLLFPSHTPASAVRFDNWNGFVTDSAITTEPLPRWPFGRCAGFGSALDASGRDSAGLLQGGTSTWYRTAPIDLGVSKRVEVKTEIFGFVPATVRQSNLTFGDHTLSDQRWAASAAIDSIVLPEAEQPIGTISYSVAGLPAGLSFTASTRTIAGTPLNSTGAGTARYIARDEAGGEAALEFDWTIAVTVAAPATPSNLQFTPDITSASMTWSSVVGANFYEIQQGSASTGPFVSIRQTVEAKASLTGLTASTTYWIRMRAKNGGGDSDWTTPVSFTTAAQIVAPAIPTGLAQEAVTATSITVDWTASASVTSYEIRWRASGAATWPAANIRRNIAATEHTVTGLASASAFEIGVQARNQAGPSGWSASVTISTLSTTYAAPVVSSIVGTGGARNHLTVTLASYSGLSSVEIEVTASPADSVHGPTAKRYAFGGAGPYRIDNVVTGSLYRIRARVVLANAAKSEWSDWTDHVFSGVPSQPRSLTATATATSVTLSWMAPEAGSPTSYTIEWRPLDTPTATVITGVTGVTRTISGLASSKAHRFVVKAVNANGAGLGATVDATTSASTAAPDPPTNRRAIAVGPSVVLLSWTESDRATSYDIEASTPGAQTRRVGGVTGDRYEIRNLPRSNATYAIRIRAKTLTATGAWANFVEVTTVGLSSDYAVGSFSATRGAGRRLNYTLTTPVDSGVAHFQLRYTQNPDSLTDDNVLPDPVILTEIIPNSYTSGTRTFTGSFDPGFSDRYYVVQVRALVDTDDGAWSRGLSPWKTISNSVSLTNPTRTLDGTVLAGKEPLPAPVLSATQHIDAGVIYLLVHLNPPESFYEQPNQTGERIDVSMTVNGAAVDNLYTYSDLDEDELIISGQSGLSVGDAVTVTVKFISAHMAGSSASISRTIVDPAQNPAVAPAPPGAISLERNDNDVEFEWVASPDADGYEVRTIEDAIGDRNATVERTGQLSTATSFEKIGGRNEFFRLSVRAYKGSGSGRLFSAARTFDHSPPTDAWSVGKVTGLELFVPEGIPNATGIEWRRIDNADGYTIQMRTGASWGAASTFAQIGETPPSISLNSVSDFTARVRGYRGSGAARVHGLAWSAIAHKASTSPDAGAVGDVEKLVAVDRRGVVSLAWTAAPNASAYRIEKQAGGSWSVVEADASGTAFETTEPATTSASFRLRGETDEGEGAWTVLHWTASSLVGLGAISHIRTISTQTSIEVRWRFPDGIYAAGGEYRKGTSGNWTALTIAKYRNRLEIEDLDENSTYQIRLRSLSGNRKGDWTTTTTTTLQCLPLAGPTGLTIQTADTGATITWDAVSTATSYTVTVSTSPLTTQTVFTQRLQTTTSTRNVFVSSAVAVQHRPMYLRVRIVTNSQRCGGVDVVGLTISWQDDDVVNFSETAAEGLAAGTKAQPAVPAGLYAGAEVESISALARPYLDGIVEERCFLESTDIDAFALPAPTGGEPPWTLTVTGLPAGLTFDPETREVSGTPTASAPREGYAVVLLTDANGAFDRRSMRWILASAAPQSWSEVGGGLGRMNNPFQIECTTKGNIRPMLWTGGATNAHDIEHDLELARGLMVWFRCPTTYPHTARLLGADAPDFDLVVKVGSDWYFSDTDDPLEFLRVPGHPDGALIGIYRYAETTTSTGANNAGEPLILEWYPDVVDAPASNAGDGAVGFSEQPQGTTTLASPTVPGMTETDVYLLHRNGQTGAWTRRTQPLAAGWTDVGTNAREIRFEFHLKRWENRAVRRITSFYRDRS